MKLRTEIEGLTVGRMVHYVLPLGPGKGGHRSAVVACVHLEPAGAVNLHVFLNGDKDGVTKDGKLVDRTFETYVPFDTKKGPGTWHFVEKA